VLQLRGDVARDEEWDVIVDLFMYRDTEQKKAIEETAEVEAEAEAEGEQEETAVANTMKTFEGEGNEEEEGEEEAENW